jgi:hypothetical protein
MEVFTILALALMMNTNKIPFQSTFNEKFLFFAPLSVTGPTSSLILMLALFIVAHSRIDNDGAT